MAPNAESSAVRVCTRPQPISEPEPSSDVQHANKAKGGLNLQRHPDEALYNQAREEVVVRNKLKSKADAIPVEEPKTNPNYHYIHGKVYDLRKFYDKHPGGKDILQMSAGVVDATPTFESYHAFANLPSIMSQLAKYEVKGEEGIPSLYDWSEDGFYKTFIRRIRAHLGGRADGKDSLTAKVKATPFQWFKIASTFTLHLFFFYFAFFRSDVSTPLAMVAAFLAGMFIINTGFIGMHDASHFALKNRNHWINDAFTRAWCAYSLWSGKVWMSHHVVYHHSFTGNEGLDPDIHHALPFVRKHPDTATDKEFRIFRWLGDTFGMVGWGISAVLLYVFAPGMWLGQVLMYFDYRADFTGKRTSLWNMPIFKTLRGYDTKPYEYVIYFSMIAVQIYRFNPFVTYAYIVSNNLFYSMCIVADHDLVESAVTNHLDIDMPVENEHGEIVMKRVVSDWGETQVRNSTDFLTDGSSTWNLFAEMNGSINFQSIHHIIPNTASVHLPKFAPILHETCKEFGVPYTAYPRIQDAWYSFLLVMRSVMTQEDIPQADLDKLKAE